MIKVMSVFGARPESIKMCPFVKKLHSRPGIESIVCVTGNTAIDALSSIVKAD